MVNYGYSQERIIAEIERCEVPCAKCHQKEHNEPPPGLPGDLPPDRIASDGCPMGGRLSHSDFYPDEEPWRGWALRAWIHTYKLENGCERCDEEEAACLEFHRIDKYEKTVSLEEMIVNESFKDHLFEEIEKCEVVCKNCHRNAHYEVLESVG
jgi:hypothetical protein